LRVDFNNFLHGKRTVHGLRFTVIAKSLDRPANFPFC
jgi:hypothetical protein